MTDSECEQRLRKVEDWCHQHDVRCSGLNEKYLAALEALRTSVSVTTRLAETNDKRLDEQERRWAKLYGILAAVSAIAGFAGSILGSYLK